jgi:amidase
MSSRRESAVSLLKKYVARIDDIDRRGPALKSVIELNPDAVSIARALDVERQAKGPRGPLHGVPVLLKDNIDTADRMMTTAGSLALVGPSPVRDSFVARRLREAGAVIVGKTNLSEWANFRSSRSTSGWSGRGGLTKNPYVLDRNPSGSSSGSAVAVAANLCSVAVGTETDGSIISPSSFNGIVGIKPTLGLISRAGIIPIAHSQDTAGPMARTVTDAAILLGALAGADTDDPVTQVGADKSHNDFRQFLDANGLKGARIGVARKYFPSDATGARAMDTALEAMKVCGGILIDLSDGFPPDDMWPAEEQVLLYEFKTDLNAYLANRGTTRVKTLKEVIEFNVQNKEAEMPYFGQELFLKAEEKGSLTEKAYLDSLEKCRRLSRHEGIDSVMERHRLDAIVAPSGGPAHRTDLVHGDRDTGGSSSPAAVAGYPSITVPAATVFGLPMGISFFGRVWSESTLIRLAFAFEQATRFRRLPQFLATVA